LPLVEPVVLPVEPVDVLPVEVLPDDDEVEVEVDVEELLDEPPGGPQYQNGLGGFKHKPNIVWQEGSL